MRDELASKLRKYQKRLLEIGWVGASLLNAGKSERDVRRTFAELNLKPTEELVDFFCLTDGTNSDGGESLDQMVIVPIFIALSLAESAENYVSLAQARPDCRNFCPIMSNYFGDFVLVNLDTSSATYGAVTELWEGYSPQTLYCSISDFLDTYIAAAASKILYIDETDDLVVDKERFAVLAATMNPNIPFWARNS